jgi:hypothetical protein
MARTPASWRNARARRVALPLLVTLGLLAPGAALADSPTITVVKVEREKPTRQKRPTLRFLKANRDFIRTRFDRLRQVTREERVGAGELDARFLTYRELLAAIARAKDSVAVSADERERRALFARIGDLARLEAELDQMERLLTEQQQRLGVLQADFAGRQRTELDVLVTGAALAGVVDSVVVVLEDGTRVVSGLDETQRQALARGGAFEVFRGLVEPREQVIEIRFEGEGWSQAGSGYVTLEPARDQLTFLRLDLAQAHPSRGLASVIAGLWLHEPGTQPAPTADADRDRP